MRESKNKTATSPPSAVGELEGIDKRVSRSKKNNESKRECIRKGWRWFRNEIKSRE
jgi:hypothetical protein